MWDKDLILLDIHLNTFMYKYLGVDWGGGGDGVLLGVFLGTPIFEKREKMSRPILVFNI